MYEQPTLWEAIGTLIAPRLGAAAASPDAALPACTALPPYEIRVHPRARRVLIRVRPGLPVLVTVPRGTPRRVAEEALREHAAWIASARLRVEAEAGSLERRRAEPVPSLVELPGIGARFVVERQPAAGTTVRATTSGGCVTLSGPVADEAAVAEAMRRWLRRVAATELSALAGDVATDVGRAPAEVSVTWPRSRWGSCSASGKVRLSADLVFLPAGLARSVVIHEFAHLRVLDHSPRFYAELETLDPEWRLHRDALRRGRDHIPGWALRD